MEIHTGKTYKHVVRNYDRLECRKKKLNQEANLYTCNALILDPPKTKNSHVLSGNQVYAKLTDTRNGRTHTRWIKKSSLIEEIK